MEFTPHPQTTFIPKKPLVSTTPSGYQRRSVSLLSVVAGLVFVLTLVGVGGVVAYTKYLESDIASKDKRLNENKAEFNEASIRELRDFSNRTTVAEELLQMHRAPSAIFGLISAKTLQTVRFTDFKFAAEGSQMALSLRGEAPSFMSVAAQSKVLSQVETLQNVYFSDINVDDKGKVIFRVEAVVDPKTISFADTIIASPQSSVDPITPPADEDALNNILVP